VNATKEAMTFGFEAGLNRLISRLPPADRQRWLGLTQTVDLAAGQTLCEADSVPTHGYFPITAVVSLMFVTQEGDCDEVGVVGPEGMVGASLLAGGRSTPMVPVVQRAGRAVRLPSATLQAEVERSAAVRRVMLEYSSALTMQVAQTAICNRHHTLDQRLARRLLEGLDRQRGSDLVMTHEQLARLLGVRRESITTEVVKLQASDLIRCSRGHILVIDRHGLEQRSCECHAVVRRELRFPPPEMQWPVVRGSDVRRPWHADLDASAAAAFDPGWVSGDVPGDLQHELEWEQADAARGRHDQLASLFIGAKLEVAALKERLGAGSTDVLQQLEHLSETINGGFPLLRQVVERPQPGSLANPGFNASLRLLGRDFEAKTGIALATDLDEVQLDEGTQLTAYRVVQESLRNIGRQAGATDVRVVMLGCGSDAVMTIRANGKGLDAAAQGTVSPALAGMHHSIQTNGGQLTVCSTPGLGTLVTAVLHGRAGGYSPAVHSPWDALTHTFDRERARQPPRLSRKPRSAVNAGPTRPGQS
jgi:signal transduction histidine kinase